MYSVVTALNLLEAVTILVNFLYIIGEICRNLSPLEILKGFFWIFFYVRYSSLLHLPPLQIPLWRKMLGSNPGQLRQRHWLSEAWNLPRSISMHPSNTLGNSPHLLYVYVNQWIPAWLIQRHYTISGHFVSGEMVPLITGILAVKNSSIPFILFPFLILSSPPSPFHPLWHKSSPFKHLVGPSPPLALTPPPPPRISDSLYSTQ